MAKKSSDALPRDAEGRDPVLVEVGQRLIDARLDWGRRMKPIRVVSQASVGRMVGVSGVTVGAWDAGKNDAGTPMLYKLADLYGVRRAWLLSGDGPMYASQPASQVPTGIEHYRRIETGADLRNALGEPEPEKKRKGRGR